MKKITAVLLYGLVALGLTWAKDHPRALAGFWFEVLTLPQPGVDLDLQAGSGAKAGARASGWASFSA